MAKVTSKLQVTIPERIAGMYGIRPGDSISFHEAGEVIRVLSPDVRPPANLDRAQKFALFDAATRLRLSSNRRGHSVP